MMCRKCFCVALCQGVKGFSRDYSLRQKDEKLTEPVDPSKVESEPKPFSQANRASINQVSDVHFQSSCTCCT
jgi:hypothetical protein